MLNYGIGLVKDWTGKDKDQAYKDQDKDEDLTCKDKDKDKDKDLDLVLKESLRTRAGLTSLVLFNCYNIKPKPVFCSFKT